MRSLVLVLFLLFSAAPLLHSSGDSPGNGSSESVTVLAGEVAVLPCSFNISASDEIPTVEWSKQHLVPNVIFLYRDGCEDHEMKHPDFRYRTGFLTPELKNGIISLRISSVKRSDSGMYQCTRLLGSGQRHVTTVELIVDWFPQIKLSTVSDGGNVILECKVTCSLPLLEIHFLDDSGNDLSAEEPQRHKESGGCYNVTRRMILDDVNKRVTCSVHQPEVNQTRTKSFQPVCPRNWSPSIVIAVVGYVGCTVMGGVVAVLIYKMFSKNQQSKKTSSDRSPIVDELKREVLDLKLQVQQRDATIRQLEMDHSQISPAVYQHQPTVPDSPATSTSSDAPKSAKLSQTRCACAAVSTLVKRSMSDSCDRPACRGSKRRYSLLVLSSNLPVVPGNSEESEGLLS